MRNFRISVFLREKYRETVACEHSSPLRGKYGGIWRKLRPDGESRMQSNTRRKLLSAGVFWLAYSVITVVFAIGSLKMGAPVEVAFLRRTVSGNCAEADT